MCKHLEIRKHTIHGPNNTKSEYKSDICILKENRKNYTKAVEISLKILELTGKTLPPNNICYFKELDLEMQQCPYFK